MISISNFSFEFGGRYLYKNADLHIKPGERIGLVGKNGTGKSTLLRIISGEYQMSEGDLSKLKSLSMGFLNQDLLSYNTGDSITNVAMQAFERQLYLEKEIEKLLLEVETNYTEQNLHKLSEMQEEFLHTGGYDMRFKTEEILEGLGFKTEDLNKPLSQFSGGWRMRVMLAKMLLMQPQLLMLDEPTNHLDLPSIQWLETYLTDYNGTVIIVSHDRYFLNRMVTKIVEIANQKIYQYTGNFDDYLLQKKERDELQTRQFENQQQYIKEQEKFIERFRAKASKATLIQSRVKMLERLDIVEAVQNDNSKINVKFIATKQPGKIIYELKHIEKSYGENQILSNTDAAIVRGDRIALIGANGKGKSTLLRIIDGSEKFLGVVQQGYNVIKAFYAQHQLESLNIENTVLEELAGYATNKTEIELRTLLGGFLFHGDDVFKKIKVLSGGEKARVSLAKIVTTGSNFLILDEPTNHLDMQSIDILIEVLNNYNGSYIIVSHDRHFISKTSNKIWWLEDCKIKEYPGSYSEFEASETLKSKKNINNHNAIKSEIKPVKKQNLSIDKNQENKKKKLQNQLNELEKTIEKLNNEISKTEIELAKEEVYINPDKFKNTLNSVTLLKKELEKTESEFENIFEQLLKFE
ncbi:MAG: ABC-F family ATP-binding cassette domain-containing protein [Bacteroidetes bacterium]|nr:ABC-F family ATP-binding cassette domain-containing protein [Bacteroidota bacterium]